VLAGSFELHVNLIRTGRQDTAAPPLALCTSHRHQRAYDRSLPASRRAAQRGARVSSGFQRAALAYYLIPGQQEAFTQINELEKGLRMAALTSVKLRKTLNPMTMGLRSMATAISIIDSWRTIEPPAKS